MKRSFASRIGAAMLIAAMAFSVAACGSDKESKKKTAEETTPSTEATTTVPTTTETTVPTYSGPMTNDIAVSWEEQELQGGPVDKYVTCTDFINVRKGPGTEYEVVAKFANKMKISVVSVTSNNWYKTNDGFYVSADLVTDTPAA